MNVVKIMYKCQRFAAASLRERPAATVRPTQTPSSPRAASSSASTVASRGVGKDVSRRKHRPVGLTFLPAGERAPANRIVTIARAAGRRLAAQSPRRGRGSGIDGIAGDERREVDGLRCGSL